MTYQTLIIKASRDFEVIGWVQYDRAFRRQAAVTKDLHWSKINTMLYSVCFAGRAKVQALCSECLSPDHTKATCPNAREFGPPWLQMQGWMHSQAQAHTVTPYPGPAGEGEVCRLFNHPAGPRCTFANCKYKHICSQCRAPHPRSRCRKLQTGFHGQAKKPRMGYVLTGRHHTAAPKAPRETDCTDIKL